MANPSFSVLYDGKLVRMFPLNKFVHVFEVQGFLYVGSIGSFRRWKNRVRPLEKRFSKVKVGARSSSCCKPSLFP